MNYDSMIREDLIAEIKALNNTIDQQVEKKLKFYADKFAEDSKRLTELVVSFAVSEHDQAVRMLEDLRRPSNRVFHYLNPFAHKVPYSITYHLVELNKAIKEYKDKHNA